MRSRLYIRTFVCKAMLYFISFSLLGICFWMRKYFGVATIDQALSTVQFGFAGAFTTDPIFVRRLIMWGFVAPLIITLVFLMLDSKIVNKKSRFFLHTCSLFLFLGSIIWAGHQFSFIAFIKNFSTTSVDYFKMQYVDPRQMTFQKHDPKSLVLIYVESLEATYSNTNLFGHDLLHRLNAHKAAHVSFADYKMMPGTNWTIAGIIATQCGIPLKLITVFDRNRQGVSMQRFLPGAVCLGDILAQNGYENVFMNGPDLTFSGADKFFSEHHYSQIYGRAEWLAAGYERRNMNYWGLYDDDLFAQAKTKLNQLVQSNKLFNLTILTIDTHGPSGYLNHTCKQQGFNDFNGIVECTANEVADFVDYVKAKGWLDKLNIVIVGDHLAMPNSVYPTLLSAPSRSIFNLIVSNQPLHKNTDVVVGFDFFPSILELTGIQFAGHRLGLGYSAFSPEQSIQPNNRLVEMKALIENKSPVYNKLWIK